MDNIRLDKTGAAPLYRQLADRLKEAIRQGELVQGERLPPIRAWKERLGISPVTATQAYEVLAQEGFTTGQVGRGTFVTVPAPPAKTIREVPADYAKREVAPLRPELTSYLKTGRAAQVQRYLATAVARYEAKTDHPADMIVMTSGNPAPERFALSRWKDAMQAAGESLEQETSRRNLSFQYGAPLGDEETRGWLADYLSRVGIKATLPEVMLTSGAQQALDLLTRAFMGPGEPLLVESPCYFSALEIFESRGVELLPVPLDDDGLQLDVLERLVERHHPRLLYTVPTSHNPTGIMQSVARRTQLLELAERYNFFIIEDDNCNEFCYSPTPPTLKSLDRQDRVIYIKSFSKLIFPAVRLGAVIAAEPIMEKLSSAKAMFDRATSLPTARTVFKFCSSPAFERELRQSKSFYQLRRDTFVAALERELAGTGCQWTRCQGGFSLLLTLPRTVRADEFYLETAERGLAVLPAMASYPVINEAPTNVVRLSFGDNPPDRLEEAARRLGQALQVFGTRKPLLSGTPFMTSV